MVANFELKITEQHWLGEPGEQSQDACSHGGIRAAIGGTVVTSEETEYGVSQIGPRFATYAERDRCPEDRANDGYLLCHGCGYPVVFGCDNFGTDWLVRHQGDEVVLSQPRLVGATGSKDFDIHARVRAGEYRRQIVSFATDAQAFYRAFGPRPVNDWELEMHAQFWAEFDERLRRA